MFVLRMIVSLAAPSSREKIPQIVTESFFSNRTGKTKEKIEGEKIDNLGRLQFKEVDDWEPTPGYAGKKRSEGGKFVRAAYYKHVL